MLAEVIAGEAFERLQVVNLANQLLAQRAVHFFGIMFSNEFCVFGGLYGGVLLMQVSFLDARKVRFPMLLVIALRRASFWRICGAHADCHPNVEKCCIFK